MEPLAWTPSGSQIESALAVAELAASATTAIRPTASNRWRALTLSLLLSGVGHDLHGRGHRNGAASEIPVNRVRFGGNGHNTNAPAIRSSGDPLIFEKIRALRGVGCLV